MVLRAVLVALVALGAAVDLPGGPHALVHRALADADALDAAAAAPAAPQRRRSQEIVFEFGGETREAYLYIPEAAVGAVDVPLVFNYYGFTGSGLQQETSSRMSALADAEGFAVIYPNGVPLILGQVRSHNGGSCCECANNRDTPTDDVGFARALTGRVAELLGSVGSTLDRGRIYSTDMSNGGFTSIRLGCESRRSDRSPACSATRTPRRTSSRATRPPSAAAPSPTFTSTARPTRWFLSGATAAGSRVWRTPSQPSAASTNASPAMGAPASRPA